MKILKLLSIKGFLACLLIAAPLNIQATPYNPVTTDIAKPIFKIGNTYTINGVTYTPSLNENYNEVGVASWYGSEFHGNLTSNGEVFNKELVTAASTILPLPSIVEITNLDNGKKLLVRVNDRGPYASGRIIDVSEKTAELLGFKKEGTANVRVKIIPELSKKVAQQMPNYEKVMESFKDSKVISAEHQTSNDLFKDYTMDISSNIELSYDDNKTSYNKANPTLISADNSKVNNIQKVSLVVPEGIQQYVPRGVFVQVGAFVSNNNKIKEDISVLSNIGVVILQNIDINGKNVLRVRVGPYGSIEDANKVKSSLIKLGYKNPRVVIEN